MDNPRILFAHVEGSGDAAAVAMTMRTAIQQTGNRIVSAATMGTTLNIGTLSSILNGSASTSGGDGVVHIDRAGAFRMFGAVAPRAMGAHSVVQFDQSGSTANVAFEIAVLPTELAAVSQVIRTSGLMVTGMHNHHVAMNPPLYFLHGSALGDPTAIARMIRMAIDRTASEGSPAVVTGGTGTGGGGGA